MEVLRGLLEEDLEVKEDFMGFLVDREVVDEDRGAGKPFNKAVAFRGKFSFSRRVHSYRDSQHCDQ